MLISLMALAVRYVTPWLPSLKLDARCLPIGFYLGLWEQHKLQSLWGETTRERQGITSIVGQSQWSLPLCVTTQSCLYSLARLTSFLPYWRLSSSFQILTSFQDPVQIPLPPQNCLHPVCPSQSFHRHLSPEP